MLEAVQTPYFRCRVNRRVNQNGHIVFDIRHFRGGNAYFSVVMWTDGTAELFMNGERHARVVTDKQGDHWLDLFEHGHHLPHLITIRTMINIFRDDEDRPQVFISWEALNSFEGDVDGLTLRVTDEFLQYLATTPVEDIWVHFVALYGSAVLIAILDGIVFFLTDLSS